MNVATINLKTIFFPNNSFFQVHSHFSRIFNKIIKLPVLFQDWKNCCHFSRSCGNPVRVLSIIFRLTITVIWGDTGREERVCHNRELSEVDIILVLTRRGHYSPAGKFSFPIYTHCLQSLIFSIIIHYCFILYI